MPEDPTPPPAIEVKNLVKSYAGVAAVSDVSFTVKPGEIIGFLGPNGAGKSTTMRILTGFLPATSGIVNLCGVPVASNPDAIKRLIGYMPENNPLPEDMRVTEYLYYRGRLKEVPRRKLSARIDEVLELCDLKRVRHRIIGKLSKGFRQRVGIAEAVLAEPPVIINQGRIVASGTPNELRREILGHCAYKLELAGEVAALAVALAQVETTLVITSQSEADDAGFRTFHLTTERDDPLGEELLRVLSSDPRFRLRGLAQERPSLEDVFLAATRRTWEMVDTPAKR